MKDTKKRYKLIACMTIADELDGMVPDNVETEFLEFGLHTFPDRLNERLREVINNTTGFDAILLGYGLCSKATLGLGSPEARLVIPRVHDCIGIFMGSHKKYREQMDAEPGTYYLTKGWIEHGGDPWKVYQQWQEEFGEKMATLLLNKTIGNYTRLAFIRTTTEDQQEYMDYARMAAENLGLRYDSVPGNRELLRKMLTGDWDEDFVVIEPGKKASLLDFFDSE
jgi:hypothetical protein